MPADSWSRYDAWSRQFWVWLIGKDTCSCPPTMHCIRTSISKTLFITNLLIKPTLVLISFVSFTTLLLLGFSLQFSASLLDVFMITITVIASTQLCKLLSSSNKNIYLRFSWNIDGLCHSHGKIATINRSCCNGQELTKRQESQEVENKAHNEVLWDSK